MNATLRAAFTPNEHVSRRTMGIVVMGWFVIVVGYWTFAASVVFPSLPDVIEAFPTLWSQDGLGQELVSSLTVNWQALTLAVAVSLPIGYLSRTPAFAPLARGVTELRFISPAVFFLVLLFLASSGHEIKVLMLALGEAFFLVTTVVGIVQAVPAYRLDDCRTLRMSEWQVTWYAVVRGTLADVIDAIRDNAAMGWSMLMMVEGFVRSEGGVGVLILNQEKHMNMAEVYCLAVVITVVGLGQDWMLGKLREAVCPWAMLARDRG